MLSVLKFILSSPSNRGKKMRQIRRAVQWQVHKRIRRTPRVLRLANGALFQAHPDCVVSSSLVYTDWPEYHELQFIRRNLRRSDVVIDVGANVGHFSLLLSDKVQRENLFAFEPTPITYRRLTGNWQLNGWPTEQLFPVAVGAESRVVSIEDVAVPDTMMSLNRASGGGLAVEVLLKRLDDYRSYWAGKTIGILKIDVEGYEPEVFAGAKALLHNDRPSLIMFESLEDEVSPAVVEILEAASYVIFELNSEGEPDFDKCSSQNIFAVPKEKRSEIERVKC